MRLAKLFAQGAVALALALAACSSDSEPGGRPDASLCDPAVEPECTLQSCELDEDCGDPKLYLCNREGFCQAACTSSADCRSHPKFEGGAWPGCDSEQGCSCAERRCVAEACTSDAECGELVCKGGACVAPDTGADGCKVFPDYALIRQGQQFTFQAVAFKGSERAALATPFTWSAGHAAVELVAGSTFAGKASTAGAQVEAVKATVAGISCTAKVTVVDELGANKARVVVVDEITGRPVSGATVVADVGATRTTLAEETAVPGSYVTGTEIGSPATFSVFHQGFNYVTVAGTTKKELLVPVRRLADQRKGGFKGSFTNLPSTAISAGFAGGSLMGNFTDLEINLLLGESEPTDLTIGSIAVPGVPLPSGVAVGNKTEYRGFGVAGVCADEEKVLAGACGTQAAWGLMGTVPLSAVLPLMTDIQSGNGVNLGKALSAVMPFLKDFKSAVARDVSFDLEPGPTDYAKFTVQDFTPEQKLALKQDVVIPALPSSGGVELDGAVVLATAVVPGRGLVPLGLAAGTDTNDAFPDLDGKVIGLDVDAGGKVVAANDGVLKLRMAPNHSGTEGSRYGVVALAIPTTGLLPNGAMATAGLVTFRDSMPNLSTVELGGDFPGLVDAGSYAYREGRFTGAKLVGGASLHRLVFVTAGNHRWSVYFKDADFTVPPVPAGFEDRTMADGKSREKSASADSPRAEFIAQAIRTVGDVTMDELFEFGGADARNLNALTAAFSAYVPYTEVNFLEPEGCSGDCTIASGARTFKVKANGIEPAQAKVKFTFGTETRLSPIAADGTATAEFTVPVGSTRLTARLYAADGTTPIDPIVERQITVTANN